MQDSFFYLFAVLTLVSGFLVVANPWSRNPVTSALFLVTTMVSVAGLFVLLHAFFLAAVQVLVYAGAVVVLFLFVIMMLDLQEEQRRQPPWFRIIAGAVAVAAIALMGLKAIARSSLFQELPDKPLVSGATRALGELLFTQYLLPFEVLSVLLLVGMVGVILLSKKNLK